jgi:hypothetical protein
MSGKGGDQAFPIHLRVMTGAFAFLVGRMVLMHELMNDYGSGYGGVFYLSLLASVCFL